MGSFMGVIITLEVAEEYGGADRDRTGGLVVANDALSQLSYSPTKRMNCWQSKYFSSVISFAATIRPGLRPLPEWKSARKTGLTRALLVRLT
jgi:hypothetical protein